MDNPGALLQSGLDHFVDSCCLPVSEACKEQFLKHYTFARDILLADPARLYKIKGQLWFFISRQACIASEIAKTAQGIEVLPEHFEAANKVVKAWKAGGSTPLCNGEPG